MDARKKKIGIIAVCSILLVGMIVAVTVGVTFNKKDEKPAKNEPGKVTTSKKAIHTLCQSTSYRETCERSLAKVAGNTTDPKELLKEAFKVAADKVNEAIKNSTTLKELAKEPMAKQALDVCKELLDAAVQDLFGAVDKMSPFDLNKIDEYIEDMKVWLSAAVNHQQTCLDAFKDTEGEAGEKMRGFLKTAQELTSNGLAMVGQVSTVLGSVNMNFNRRLLSTSTNKSTNGNGGQRKRKYQAVPSWMSKRKLDLLTATPKTLKPNVVVAKDGSGKYKTINAALKDIPNRSNQTFVIYVKEGVYKETVLIDKQMTNVVMIGDGPTKSRITGNKNYVDGTQTMWTATVAVVGDYFVAKDMGFENSAGAVKHQAVALRVQSDFSIFYNCHIDGYQDTLYTQTYRQYYRDCTITGTIDFIFGDAAVVFQNCKMVVRKPGDNQACMVTAQGRTDKNEITAIVLQNCTISGDKDYLPVKDKNKAYLGRPWKNYARTIVMQSHIDDMIQPEGWKEWDGESFHKNCFFGEYKNRGPRADTSKRVKWPSIKKLTPDQAKAFTPVKFFEGDRWIKPSGVAYTSGMISV